MDKISARSEVLSLIKRFEQNKSDYLKSTYNETQARNDFITPLLEAFGWDVHNNKGLPTSLREVIEEATVEVGEERISKKPDYELRLSRQRKIFVEAKKPSIPISSDKSSAFQVRRYGFSASLPISILTNFNELVVYDCIPNPSNTDDATFARILLIRYDEFEKHFDELWDIFSRDSIYSGAFDLKYAINTTRKGSQQFDDLFLNQVRDWRVRIALDMYSNTPSLTSAELSFAVQLFISRLVFLRICEDRDIEKYEMLKLDNSEFTYKKFMKILKRADSFYDSGLFSMINDEKLGICISDDVLKVIISELYYPYSPYTFAVVETQVLGEIYEQFLGEEVSIVNGVVKIIEKPEVRASGGVFPTPGFIVDSIIDNTVVTILENIEIKELSDVTILDPCCGSGIFLLSAYERLLEYYLDYYVRNKKSHNNGERIYEVSKDNWKLTYEEKRRILINHIRGVDIDYNAVEMTKFSLCLKLIENETIEDLKDFVQKQHISVLPSLDRQILCGNSLISNIEWKKVMGRIKFPLLEKVNPFDWMEEFPVECAKGGFDVIIENPPYSRIQTMKTYSPEEVDFFKLTPSYKTSKQDNYDKYFLFIERSMFMLKPAGQLGAIIPHKFMTIKAGNSLRRLLTQENKIKKIIHFGTKQVFGVSATNYTCILFLNNVASQNEILFEKVGELESWRYDHQGIISKIPKKQLTENSWQFADDATQTFFNRIRTSYTKTLKDEAEIFVGVQTSADSVFIIQAIEETVKTITVKWDNHNWIIEKNILRPFLHDIPLTSYCRPVANSWIIFPYLLEETDGKMQAKLVQPKEFKKYYPGCYSYLIARRKELENRKIVGGISANRQWYQYGRSQSLTKFNSPKIIYPVLSTEPRYVYDDANTLVTGGGNGPYYLIRPKITSALSISYLLAILNHPLSESFIRSNTSSFRGGYYSHGKQFIENIPIPVPSKKDHLKIDTLVQDLIGVNREIDIVKLPKEIVMKKREALSLNKEIENAISNLYGLSIDDLTTIKSVSIL